MQAVRPFDTAARFALAAVLSAASAAASPSYPGLLQTDLGLEQPPPCTVCHASDSGGTGTATKPFGEAMQGFGLRGATPGSLEPAIKASENAHWDSDGDGVTDIDELQDGTDPNDGPGRTTASAVVIPQPENGCSLQKHRPAKGDAHGMLLGLLGLGILEARRRARRGSAARCGPGVTQASHSGQRVEGTSSSARLP